MPKEVLKEIASALANLHNSNRIVDLVEQAVSQKIPVNIILEEGLRKGLDEVGRKYEGEEYFLSDLLFAASLMQDATRTLKPRIDAEGHRSIGTMILGTVRGDIHDIGKNVFKMLSEGSGFAVIDLGVDVDPEAFVGKVKDTNANILAASALLTTATTEMRTLITALVEAGLRDSEKVIIGGNAVTKKFGEEIGADAAALDAVEGVGICKGWLRK